MGIDSAKQNEPADYDKGIELAEEHDADIPEQPTQQEQGVNIDGYKELVEINKGDIKIQIGSSTWNTAVLCAQAIQVYDHIKDNGSPKKEVSYAG